MRMRGLQTPLLALALAGSTAVSAQKTFRSAVDVIAVDVQVVDPDGNPVERLGPEVFEVSIKGHRRKVVSASFIRNARALTPVSTGGPGAGSAEGALVQPPQAAAAEGGGRTFILAIDNGSFEIGTAREAMEAVQGFLGRLEPEDRVGLYVYPTVVWIPPTTARAQLRVGVARVIGEKMPLRSRYNLRPGEIVDITTESNSPHSFLAADRARGTSQLTETMVALDPVLQVQRRECPDDVDCPSRIYSEGMEMAVQLEHQAQTSLGGLEALLQNLAALPGRKAVVLVSAGVLVSDKVDGRPDVGNVASVMGQTAARANASVYTVHVDLTFSTSGSASQRGAPSSDRGRDRALMAGWLDQFSASAGGKRIYVPVGSADFAFARVLRESSAYYLLGVEPQEADRDGKTHELKVKVNRRKVTVRSRQWVMVPAGV
jgi:VWFA-related protein